MNSPEKLPRGWVKVKSKSHPGKVYYYNSEAKQSVWKLKDITTPEKGLPKQNRRDMTFTPKKSPEKTLSRVSERSKTVGKKNLAEQRMKNLRMALELEKNEPNEVKKSKGSQKPIENARKPPKKESLSPRKRAERKDLVVTTQVIENMDVDISSSQEQEVKSIPENSVESMEWEEIDEGEVVKEVLHVRSLKSRSSSLIPHGVGSKRNDKKFFIVVDTNIFCSNLQFVDRIKGKQFKGKTLRHGSVIKLISSNSVLDLGMACIYIPYIVLCELDMLKTRDGNISKAAQRGIKTINEYFKQKDCNVTGQNVKDDTRELIPIESGDDRILNCAFQLKELTNKVLLLSNDINLRNKAHVNGFVAHSVDMLNYADYNLTNTIKFE